MEYLSSLLSLKGKTVAITGAGGHLCSKMAIGFHKSGCNVVVMDLKIKDLKIVFKSFKPMMLSLDVKSKKNFKDNLDLIKNKFGRIDILINGAGINAPTPFLDISESEWDDILSVHLKGTLFGCQVFGGQMLKQKHGGSIINISSASAGPPLSKAFAYSVAKAGIKNLTQNIAREWAKKGVRVNAIRPGFFPTEWSKKNFITVERDKAIIDHTPMGRYGKPEELIGAVLWLSSDAASFVTGAEIAVDGGFSAMTI